MTTIKKELQQIHRDVLKRFTYISDIKKWNLIDHWPSPDQLPTDAAFTGDCDDFALMCRKMCRERNIKSRLVLCIIEDRRTFHLVCESDGYILDNRCIVVVEIKDLDYEWKYISGYEAGDDWHFVSTELN